MEFTEKDREALYNTWMSQKSKMRLTQMEFAKKLGISQLNFSQLLRGEEPLTMSFISHFCRLLHLDAKQIFPSLKEANENGPKVVYLQSRMSVDGEIQNAYIEGNQIVVEYAHTVN
ncbi:helix-turn-helix domain-containing protein [Vibrio sp. Isolate25]|uniref:helix-turn-helix domain-containing protein n=1 Tax=Vibrio TaxID=662 RepID=UPI001EFCB6B8|nr:MULTISPECIES: helix-turn-helix transcriptional regulator [Vibrio]MCG9595396.1 helix-turn-helix domain-containing protein [Vibrio sp. Isolate25]MCG9676885.1 helix-turn-helix domain-containing protein [Vibrio sp. Isolate24]MCG9681354.1 helix-turn-helix domain-containing protein [Vibrio sp. Isolate23]USD34445.1 helix-turn-helix transcriptional regulator [Vibrio sp. SCSIO 43186]USD47517.1 helix-turn-helix transcriptional regulator [Vibrio sp. SCSIO 43145]